ncbi:MAG: transcription elongation factor GreA [Rickettsiales bacterium]|nr:MAG: transcription elongation factor GreA [Rickettsiales bacterium]
MEGFNKLENELRNLKTNERPAIIKAISEARELGDLSENAEYHAAREQQSLIEGKIIDLEDKVARAEVLDIAKLSGEVIKFGATVKLIDEDTSDEHMYTIVGEYESDISKSLISVISPLAKALIGKTIGDYVEVITPRSTKAYEIIDVKYNKNYLQENL